MSVLTTAWDENKMDENEVDALEIDHKARRSQLRRGPSRASMWFLDRRFFRALRSGESVNDSRENAIAAWSQLQGFVVGVVLSTVTFVTLAAVTSEAEAGNWVALVFNVAVWGLCLLYLLGRLGPLLRSLGRKVRRRGK